MKLDIEDYRFIGLANTVAMEEYSASFDYDYDRVCAINLLNEYKEAKQTTDSRAWLRSRLATIFVAMDSRPVWIHATQAWPFINGQAMTFINQFSVKENDVSISRLSANTELYVFGLRVPVEEGWEMRYQVVQQHFELARLR